MWTVANEAQAMREGIEAQIQAGAAIRATIEQRMAGNSEDIQAGVEDGSSTKHLWNLQDNLKGMLWQLNQCDEALFSAKVALNKMETTPTERKK